MDGISEEEVDSDNSEAEVGSDDSDDESSDDFDTEWLEFQDLVSSTEEKLKTFWQDDNFRKAFKKFKNKFSKLRNSNQNTVIRHFHHFAIEKKGSTTTLFQFKLLPLLAKNSKALCLRQVDATRR